QIMHARKDSHGHVTRIVADKHLVDLENRPQLSVQLRGGNVRQIEKDLVVAAHAKSIDAHLKDLARRDVARHEIAVRGISLFEEIPALVLRNRRWRSDIALFPRHPHTSTFTASRFGHQSQLVFAGNRRRMNLYELTIRVPCTLLVTR